MTENEKYKLLKSADWETIIKKATVYAVYQFKFWGILSESGIKGYTPEEIVMEAIEKVFNGEWNWDPEKSDLLTYLKYHVIKGLIANLKKNDAVKKHSSSNINDLKLESPEIDVIENMTTNYFFNYVMDKLSDIETKIIFEGLFDGMKRREICNANNWNKNTYDNALKRLNTQIRSLGLKEALKK